MMDRFAYFNFAHSYQHIAFPDAGHTLNEWFMLGGTKEGNREARLGHLAAAYELLRSLER